MRHFELAVLNRKGELALDQIQSLAAENIAPPALEDRQIAKARCKRFQLIRTGQKPRGNIDFSRPDFEQKLEQISHQCALFTQRRAAFHLLRHFIFGQWL